MFNGASNFVEGVDTAFALIIGISLFFLIGITTLMIVFTIKYSRKRHPKAVQIPNNTPLEITWTVIPVILVMVMFYFGYVAFTPERNAPKDALVIKTTGRMWSWDFEYPNGKHSQELVVPFKKPVKLNMTSVDVIHSLYISAFRVKEDLVPGRQTMMWFIPEQLGQFDILCAEYCGLRHSYMESVVKVVSQEEYDAWLAKVDKNAGMAGLEILQRNACVSCHSTDGSKIVGPSFKGLFGNKHMVITDGKEREVTADEAYITSSILDPNKDVVKGFNQGLMKSYKGVLKDDEIKSVIEYLQSIK
jgi:cytochrome c oxidase subunit 2